MNAKYRDYSILVFLIPFGLLFMIFIGVPIILAVLMSFTYFNGISPPVFSGLQNYLQI